MKKKCSKCGETKGLSEFYKHKSMKDGHGNYCKPCTKIIQKNFYDKKNKKPNNESSDVVKDMLWENYNRENKQNKNISPSIDRLSMIEKLCHAMLDEIQKIKKESENNVEHITD
jgi:hypothetical protein